ncbi:spermine/spermidine synthase domain-containing protein [Pseudomonas sp. RIT-To-2]|uniref:spermine/spermidine synthase domain-containing protein n=1 Tax=Pseudomonas sp. RIT-To-2 TaxID=3462541 RepID=UPI0024139458
MILNLACQSHQPKHDKVFCGDYYDDMGCIGYLGDQAKDQISVLMLGLSDGLALAPIASSTRVTRIVSVDLDETASVRSMQNRKRIGSHIYFESVVADAETYVAITTHKYDVIVVDLYTDTGYAPIMLDHNFHLSLKRCLNPLGHLVFNSFGVPMNLDPFTGPSPQAWMAQRLREIWGQVYYLPHRRNATFIIGLTSILGAKECTSHLCDSDRVFKDLMLLRLRHISLVPVINLLSNEAVLDFESINVEMLKRWQDSLPKLATFLNPPLTLVTPADLRLLLSCPDECRSVQNKLVKLNTSLRTTLAILVANEVNLSEKDMSWLVDWVATTLENSDRVDPKGWLDGYLPCAYSLVINGAQVDTQSIGRYGRLLDNLAKLGPP